MRAMILAAGLGTRLKPLTDSTPKALIKIKNHTLLELQIKKLKSEGFNEIIINVHHFADHDQKIISNKIIFSIVQLKYLMRVKNFSIPPEV